MRKWIRNALRSFLGINDLEIRINSIEERVFDLSGQKEMYRDDFGMLVDRIKKIEAEVFDQEEETDEEEDLTDEE